MVQAENVPDRMLQDGSGDVVLLFLDDHAGKAEDTLIPVAAAEHVRHKQAQVSGSRSLHASGSGISGCVIARMRASITLWTSRASSSGREFTAAFTVCAGSRPAGQLGVSRRFGHQQRARGHP